MHKVRIGHVVWYRMRRWQDGPLGDQAAIVTRVAPDGRVDLTVFDPDADPRCVRGVAADPSGGGAGTWRWPVDEDDGGPYR